MPTEFWPFWRRNSLYLIIHLNSKKERLNPCLDFNLYAHFELGFNILKPFELYRFLQVGIWNGLARMQQEQTAFYNYSYFFPFRCDFLFVKDLTLYTCTIQLYYKHRGNFFCIIQIRAWTITWYYFIKYFS